MTARAGHSQCGVKIALDAHVRAAALCAGCLAVTARAGVGFEALSAERVPSRQPAASLLGAVDVAIATAGMASGALLGVGFGRDGIGQVGPAFCERLLDTPLHVMQAGVALFGHADVAGTAGFVRLGAGLRPQPAVGIGEIDRVRCSAVAGNAARLGVNVIKKGGVHQDLLPERHGSGQ